MREKDWFLLAIETSPELENWPRRAPQDMQMTDLTEVIEATCRKIDAAFDQRVKLKGKYKAADHTAI